MQQNLYTIGEVARLSGLSVQTIRYYSDIGVLPPARVTEAGYRLYSEADCARLELVRTLRGLGFGLETIAELLKGERSPAEAVALQLEALEVQLRSLRRQQTVLRAVGQGEEPAILARLGRMHTLSSLDKLEREDFLAQHLKRGLGGTTGDPGVWRAAVLDLPEHLSEEGLETWLELAEIAASEEFQETLRRQMQPLEGMDEAQWKAWGAQMQASLAQAIQAVRGDLPPDGKAAQEILAGWVMALAQVQDRTPDPEFEGWLLEYFQSVHSPQIDRYWELVARLKGWEYTPVYAQAFHWLLEGLRWRLAQARTLEP